MTNPPLPTEVLQWLPVSAKPWRFLGSNGGFSGAQLYRATDSSEDLCLRRWPLEHPTPQRLHLINSWLSKAASKVDCLPVPKLGNDGAAWLETETGRWELSPWMPGTADYHQQPTSGKLASACQTLAQLHQSWASLRQRQSMLPPSISSRQSRLLQWQQQECSQIKAVLREQDTRRPLYTEASQLFALTQDAATRFLTSFQQQLTQAARKPRNLQPCLRDIWHDHLLFVGDELTGVVDFGAMNWEIPEADMARCLGSLIPDDTSTWHQARLAYEAECPKSNLDWDLTLLLDQSGCLVAATNWLKWLLLENRRFEDTERVSNRLSAIAKRLQKWLSYDIPSIPLTI